jgi:hypothetical protein
VLVIAPQPGDESALPNYRLYRLDGAGKIMSAEWLEAAGDEDALRDVQDRASGSFELWDKDRLVERFRASGQPPAA